jgi:hypothetical protein
MRSSVDHYIWYFRSPRRIQRPLLDGNTAYARYKVGDGDGIPPRDEAGDIMSYRAIQNLNRRTTLPVLLSWRQR